MVSLAAAAAVALAAPLAMPEEAYARDVQPYAGLTPCKKNKAFAKREKAEQRETEAWYARVRVEERIKEKTAAIDTAQQCTAGCEIDA